MGEEVVADYIGMKSDEYTYEVQKRMDDGTYTIATSSSNLQEAMQVAMHQAQSAKIEHRVVRIPVLKGEVVAIFPPIY